MKKLFVFLLVTFCVIWGISLSTFAASISLNNPIKGDVFTVGDKVKVSSTASGVEYIKMFWKNVDTNDYDLIGQSTVNQTSYSEYWDTKGKAPGQYIITVQGVKDGVIIAGPTTITVTLKAPSISLNNPIDGETFTVGDNVKVSSTASGVQYIKMFWKNVATNDYDLIGQSTANQTSYSEYWDTKGKAPGQYIITIQGIKDGVIIAGPTTITVTLKASSISLNNPIDGEIFTVGDKIKVSSTASGVQYIKMFWKNVDTNDYDLIGQSTANQTSYSEYWDTKGKAPGQYIITVQGVKDGVIIAGPTTITVTLKESSISLNNPIDGEIFTVGDKIKVSSTASGVQYIKMFWKNVDTNDYDLIGQSTANQTSYSEYWDTKGKAPGQYIITVQGVKDGVIIAGPTTITVTLKESSISLNNPIDGEVFTVGDKIKVSSTASGVQYIKMFWKNVATNDYDLIGQSTANQTSYSEYWDTKGKAPGQYIITVQGVKDGVIIAGPTTITVTLKASSIILNNPIDSETFTVGDKIKVSSTASGVQYIKMFWKNVATNDYDLIGQSTANQTSYSEYWDTKGKAPGQYIITVQGVKDGVIIAGPTTITVTLKESSNDSVSGYIAPDFNYTKDVADIILSDFKVEVVGNSKYSLTDSSGYFLINDLPKGVYTFKISKPGFLTRMINVTVTTNTKISEITAPINVWAGDLNNDGSINMADVILFAKSFNSTIDNPLYKSDFDIDKDKSINFSDLLSSCAKHFNSTLDNYPQNNYPIPGLSSTVNFEHTSDIIYVWENNPEMLIQDDLADNGKVIIRKTFSSDKTVHFFANHFSKAGTVIKYGVQLHNHKTTNAKIQVLSSGLSNEIIAENMHRGFYNSLNAIPTTIDVPSGSNIWVLGGPSSSMTFQNNQNINAVLRFRVIDGTVEMNTYAYSKDKESSVDNSDNYLGYTERWRAENSIYEYRTYNGYNMNGYIVNANLSWNILSNMVSGSNLKFDINNKIQDKLLTNIGQNKFPEASQTDMIDLNLESTPNDYGYPNELEFSVNKNDPVKDNELDPINSTVSAKYSVPWKCNLANWGVLYKYNINIKNSKSIKQKVTVKLSANSTIFSSLSDSTDQSEFSPNFDCGILKEYTFILEPNGHDGDTKNKILKYLLPAPTSGGIELTVKSEDVIV